jgi:hypothetical protein
MDTTCGKCGRALSTDEVLYDEKGHAVCQQCMLDEQAAASQQRVASKVKAVAYSGPVLGVVAFFFNPWWLISIAAIGNGIYVFKSLQYAQTAARLTAVAEKMRVAAIAGIVLGGLTAVLQLLRFFGKLGGQG